MNLYPAPSFVISILLAAFGLFVFLKSRQSALNKIFGILAIASTLWLFSYSMAYLALDPALSFFWFRMGYSGVIFITTIVFNYTVEFLKLSRLHWLVRLNYTLGFVGVFFIWNSVYLISGVKSFFWGFYPQAGPFHPFFLFFFISLAISTFSMLLYFFWFKREILTSRQVTQVRYLFLAFFIYNFASVDFLPNYGLAIYPFGYVPAFIFVLIIGYTIVKYRLMDVSLAITRTGIFIAVYSIVLGFPFILALGFKRQIQSIFGDNWWLIPMLCLTVLATLGPFIYLYIQKRAEEQILKEQRRYQATLSQASAGMGRIKDLKRLLELIVYIVTRAVRLEHSSVFIFDHNKNKYLMGAYKRSIDVKSITEVPIDSPLVAYLIQTKSPVVYEEIKQRVQDYNDVQSSKVEEALRQLDAALVVPSLIEDRLLAILVMGKKKSGKLFGEDDLSVFSILANQAALAIENAQFYEDVKNTQEQLFQAEKMATIGTMADGLSHQINNRLHALGFIAGDALDTIKIKRNAEMSKEMREVISDLERSLVRIQENVKQGGEVVQGLLRYTRKGEQGHAPVEIDKVVTAALEMAQFKIKTYEMKILREYDKTGPKINGNFTQLQEVFFNMIDNAYDAMMQRRNETNEEGYQPMLRIQSAIAGDRIIVKFIDNGIGVKTEDYQKIFTPFFTTKLSSRKGTGLGLYVIKKIVEDNHKGKVTFESAYMQGTAMILNLPIAN